MTDFNIGEFIQDLHIQQDDEVVSEVQNLVKMVELIGEDAWLCRQYHFGAAGAMEQQLTYLGGTLLPQAERKMTKLSSTGVSTETYNYDQFGFVTQGTDVETDAHENSEVDHDQLEVDQQNFIDGLRERMRTAAIIFVCHLKAHDVLSNTLEQLTYGQIKAKAAQNRAYWAEKNRKTG